MGRKKYMGAAYKNRTFLDEFIQLDGKFFENCVFDGCVLSYDGGPTFVITMDCSFINSDFRLGGLLKAQCATD